MTKLSILMCSLRSRIELRKRLLEELVSSIGEYNVETEDNGRYILQRFIGKDIEILICTDNKEMMVGDKRNLLVGSALGQYVCFVDDDDRVSEDYVPELLEGVYTGADVIVFQVSVSLNGAKPKPCYYSRLFHSDYNVANAYYRLPNHLMCIKKELAEQVKFPSVSFGEDSDFSKKLRPLLKTEHSIYKILYYYDFNNRTTETQGR